MLTGKYNDGIPEGTRLDTHKDNMFIQARVNRYFGKDNKEKYVNMFKELSTIAKELGCSQAALAMAWVIKNKDTSTAITGATRAE